MTTQPKPKPRWRRIVAAAIAVLALPAALVLLFAVVPVPATPLMLIRTLEGRGLRKDWVALERMAPALARSVIAAEDATFCAHFGFEREALEKAWASYQRGGRLRGGSTISMQTAKNVFLWPDRTFVRKGLEAWLTLYIEALWSKRRTLEVYLNVVEWGPGVYGAEAAARHHFNKSAADLTAEEAALLAAVLPSPLRWSPAKPGPYVRSRAATIQARAAGLGELGACIARS
jgi:monofunctional biosynthetic peptidoglycan transglycosylase